MYKSPSSYELLSSPSIDKFSASTTTFAGIGAETLTSTDHNDYLPPKSFASAERKKWNKALQQIGWAVFLLVLYSGIFASFTEYFKLGHKNGCTDDKASPTFKFDSLMGNFTLTEAKLIDVGFNAFGRILQTALGYVTYRNIMDMLMRALESMPVTFALYSALTLQSCTISTIGSAFNAMVSTIDWRPRFIFMMIWTILSTAFVFIFPTLMDLMSGYVPKQDSYIQFPDRTMIPFDANITNATLAQLELLHGKVRLVNGEPPKTCAHSQDRAYQWGISAFWMKVTWYSLGAWMIGTYSAWMDAQYNCELLQKKRTMNTYRAVVDLAGAMTEVLGPNMDAYSGPELENALRGESFCEENPGEIGRVMYTTEIDEATGLGRIKLSARKRGKLGKLDFNTEYGEKRF